MKKTYLLFLICFAHGMIGQNIIVDQERATVSFLFLDNNVDGTLSEFKFTGILNFNSLETATLSGTVATATIDTDNWLRDRHLRNKYFKSDAFPLLTFKSNSIVLEDTMLIVDGVLSIKGISKPTRFRFTQTSTILEGKAAINASDFDIHIHDTASRNKLTVTITLPYTSQ